MKIINKNTLLVLALLTLVSKAHSQDINRGKQLFQSKCIQCHGEKGLGNPAEKAPRIAGQHDWYISLSLKKFLSGERKNPPMLPYIKGLTSKDINDLAAYIQQLK